MSTAGPATSSVRADVAKMVAWVGRRNDDVASMSLTEAAELLAALADLAAAVKLAQQDASKRVAALRPYVPRQPGVFVEGVGTVKVRPVAEKVDWDDAELLDAVIARAFDERRIDPETGEALEREGTAVARVLADCYSIKGSNARLGSWPQRNDDGVIVKAGTGLRGYGIDPDEFRATSAGSGAPTVEIIG